jgi:hypothetical protein
VVILVQKFLFFVFYIKISSNRLVGFVIHRYTGDQPVPGSALYAWQLLGNSVYQNNTSGDGSIMLNRPVLYMEQGVSFYKYIKYDLSSKIFNRLVLI